MKTTNHDTGLRDIPLRILLLEDNKRDVKLIHSTLKTEGIDCEIIHVKNEAEFEAALAREKLDVILADFTLPDYNGFSALDLARRKAPAVPFIFVSGTLGEELAIESVKTGATDYVLKQRLGRLGGAVLRAVREAKDRAKRARVEAALQEMRHQNDLILKSTADGIFGLDRNGRVTFVNPAAAQMLGYAVEELVGHPAQSLLDPSKADTPEGRQSAIYGACERGGVNHVEGEVFWRKDGKSFPAEYASNPILNHEKKAIGAVVTFRDITERKRAEEALRDSEIKFRQLAENIQEVFWITSRDGSNVIYASPAYERVWGRPVARLSQHPQDWLNAVVPEDRPHVIDTFAQLGQGASEVTTEYRIRRPDGSVRWILDRGFPVYNEKRELYRITGIANDITERKRLDEHLRQTQKLEAMGQLAGGIAHDFNNILGCIIGYAELAAAEIPGNAAAQENLEQVLKATQRAKELVLQILAFSRRQELERKPMKLQPVIKEALKLLRASLPSTIEIKADIDTDVPTVLADATQIHQVLMNLATNAAQAMSGRPGQLSVKFSSADVDEDFARIRPDLRVGRYARLTVSDTGSGIDQTTLPRIFEPFFSTKAPGEGTGLGLAVVHGIVKSHDGAVSVYSEPGKGTTFHLYFPARGGSATDAPMPATSIPQGKGERVLFVDDEAPLVSLAKQVLERAGYHVTTHTNALEALATFRAEPERYDLVITDLTMPKLTGNELACELLKVRASLPVILVTGFNGSINSAKAHSIGIREVIMKPLTAQALAEAVHRVLKQTKGN